MYGVNEIKINTNNLYNATVTNHLWAVRRFAGSMRVKSHRMYTVRWLDGARPACSHIGWEHNDFCLKFKLYDINSDRPGTVRCPAGHRTMSEKNRNIRKSLNQRADARPGTGQCLSGHRLMFYESNCRRWEATCIYRGTYCIYIDISLLKTKYKNTKNIYCLSSLGQIACNEHCAIYIFAVLSKCVFHLYHCQSQPYFFLILTTYFFRGMNAKFDINIYIIACENLFQSAGERTVRT